MFSSLVLGAAIAAPAAPVPRDAAPAPTGPAPWVLYLKADPNGRVQLVAYTSQKIKVSRTITENQNGKPVTRQVDDEITRMVPSSFLLDEQAAKFTTAAGRALDSAQMMKQTRDGIVVLVSADGAPVDKAWLRAIGDDAVVMTADGLAKSQLPPVTSMRLGTAAPRLVLLGTDADGRVKVACNPNGSRNAAATTGRVVLINNGAGGVRQVFIGGNPALPNPSTVAAEHPRKPLEDVSFEAYDLGGKKVAREAALKRLRAGGFVIIAGDNRIPDEAYLKLFRGDLLVLVSPELINVPLNPGVAVPAQPLPVPLVRPALRLVPARALQPVPAKPARAPKPAAKAGAEGAKPAREARVLPIQKD